MTVIEIYKCWTNL